MERVYDSDRFVDYVACQTQKSCEALLATDDDCFESAGGPLTAEMLAFVGYCEDELGECAPSFSDDLCAVVSLLIRRSIFYGVDACLRGPCDDASSGSGRRSEPW